MRGNNFNNLIFDKFMVHNCPRGPPKMTSNGNPFTKQPSGERKSSSGNPFAKQDSAPSVNSTADQAKVVAPTESEAAGSRPPSNSNPFAGEAAAQPAREVLPSGMPAEKAGILKKKSPTAGAQTTFVVLAAPY